MTSFSRLNAGRGILLTLSVVCGCQDNAPDTLPQSPSNAASLETAFRDVTSQYGLTFVNQPRRASDYYLPAIIGSGCAIFDFDCNGLLDFMLVAEDTTGPCVALYQQVSAGNFSEVSVSSGLETASGTGIAVGDMNNDGWPDVYLSSSHQESLWQNRQGHFVNVTEASGIRNLLWSTSACWLDYDRDGWLDLFISNYVAYDHRPCTRLGGGDPDFCSPGLFSPTIDRLYRNVTGESGDGQPLFEDVTLTTGISAAQSAALGCMAFDWNHDDWVDLYVASDQHPNLLWINQQGTFVEKAAVAGCDRDFQGRSQGSMGLALGDFTADGIEDLVVSNLDGEPHAVYSRHSSGFSQDVSRECGLALPTRAFTGFGMSAADFNLDGVSDLLTVNGQVKRDHPMATQLTNVLQSYQQELLFLRSDAATGQWSPISIANQRQLVARGLAVGDLDRDGDPDAVVSLLGAPSIVLENILPGSLPGITLRFVDPERGGRDCPGAKYLIRLSDSQTRQGTFQPCQSYMSTNAGEVYLAVEETTITIDVIWPHGSTSNERFENVMVGSDRVSVLKRGQGVTND